jgi:FtsP/CotA-like multicopper oxidase with cupredoxin domain
MDDQRPNEKCAQAGAGRGGTICSGRVSRRRAIQLGVGLAAAGTLVGRWRWATASQTPPGGEPLAEPPVRVGPDGLLDTSLTALRGPAQVGGVTATTTVYEEIVPGPTLRVRAGDRLRLVLVNRLGEDTNLHVHGLHVSPAGNADNVFVHVRPGQTFQYEYALPADHPAGLYWYHPHLHGNSDPQLFGGMAGLLVVEGDLDALPGIAGVPERLLVLQATRLDAAGRVQFGDELPNAPLTRLVNGQVNPTLQIRPDETQRWRIANASADTFFRLQLDGHCLHQIAADGNTLASVWSRDEVLLAPGNRVEVLVQGGTAGRYALRTLAYDKGAVSMGAALEPEAVLATLVSEGEPLAPTPLPTTLLPFADLREEQVARSRTVTFQVPMAGMRGMAGMHGMAGMRGMAGMMHDMFLIDSKGFDPNRVDQTVRLGSVEEWTIRNASDEVHPFHIHVNPFQVVAVNGQRQEAHGYLDTATVPRRGEITIRLRFADFPGKFVYHCHLLMHQDGGMMGVVEVV